MSDILDVLNIKSFPQKKGKEAQHLQQQQQQQQNNAESRQAYTPDDYATSTKRRKLSAMNRELYNLIGSNVPSLAIDTASVANAGSGKKFKEKLVTTKKNAPWRHLGFKNSARPDGLVLYHWTRSASTLKTKSKTPEAGEIVTEREKETGKEDAETSGTSAEDQEQAGDETGSKEEGEEVEEELDLNEYRYAKYNTKLDIPTFTEEEYDEAMKVEEEKRQKELEAKLAKEKVKLEKEKEKEKNSHKKQDSKSASAETPQTEKEHGKEKVKEPNGKKAEEKKDSEDAEADNDDKEKSKKEESVESDVRSATETSVKSATESNAEEDAKEKPASEKDTDLADDADEKDVETEQKEEATQEEAASKTEEAEETPSEEAGERAWTYEETKFLFDLCSNYDMRWSVILDRYQDKYTDRTLEDLKVQMYTLSAHLLEKRGNLNDSALIKALRSFNKDKELERKYYLTKLIHRAPTEIAEEESLVIEARKFELAAKKMLLERAQLLQLLDSPQSSASVQQYLTSQGLTQLYNSLMSADKSKKRKAEVPVAPLLGPNAIPHTQHLQMSSSSNNNGSNSNNTNGGSNGTGNKRRSNGGQNSSGGTGSNNNNTGNGKSVVSAGGSKPPSKLSEVQQLLQKNLTAEELEVYGIEIHNERIQPGVHVRSQKIASFKPSVQAKVHEILGQMGLSVKPTMPTGPVSKKFDELLYKISHLVDLKKQSDKLLAEIELVKRQKGVL